ncbi:outer-membrane lipoprotein carrier protein LolA, partial [Neisseria gonorrhoeae]|uniref:outer-membrane lipoprotein carrier protein LolA n=1 Tax=Neisseria gonorrhoeae TaxID=485 RepID=UPI0027D9AED4
TQTVQSKKKTQTAHGTFKILRPGLFKWEYTLPYKQTIVGDGQGANGEELEQVVRFHHYFSLSGWVWRKVSARQNNHTGGV